MKWLLLMAWMGTGHSHVPAFGVAEFSSQERCEAARSAFIAEQDKTSSYFGWRRAMVCVQQ